MIRSQPVSGSLEGEVGQSITMTTEGTQVYDNLNAVKTIEHIKQQHGMALNTSAHTRGKPETPI